MLNHDINDLLISVSLQNVKTFQLICDTRGAAVFICVTWELCVCTPTGILQEAPRPHRQDRRGSVRRGGQSAEGRQRGKLLPTESRRPSHGQEAETKSFFSPGRLRIWRSRWWIWSAWRNPLWRKCACPPTPCWRLCWAPSTRSTWTWGPTWSRSRRRRRRRWVCYSCYHSAESRGVRVTLLLKWRLVTATERQREERLSLQDCWDVSQESFDVFRPSEFI